MRRRPAEPVGRAALPLRIAVEGPSGVGKTTVSRALARRLRARWIREAYDRVTPRLSLDVASPEALLRLERRFLREETRRYTEAARKGPHQKIVVLDTGFLGPATYTAGLAVRSDKLRAPARRIVDSANVLVRTGRLGLPELTIYLEVGRPELRRRNQKALRSHPARWQLRHLQVARFERRFWGEAVRRRYPGGVWFVRATGRPSSIVDGLEQRISRWKPVRPPPGLARSSLRFLAASLPLR
ncbi:MAG: AAA family ATPase [Thermoplasmata archaeon]|nr:AAA family ATPase [Thermoplasmata archaeon]